jgi:AraC-like DNA-binding protein
MSDLNEQFDPLEGFSASNMPTLLGAALDYPAGTVVDWHKHFAAQLVFAEFGVMRLRTQTQFVLLPPSMALWVPPDTRHRIVLQEQAAMRTIYVRPDALGLDNERCKTLNVSPLLRELILEASVISSPKLYETPRIHALVHLLMEELLRSREMPLTLPMPTDSRIVPMANAAMASLTDIDSIAAWSATAPASRKTVERLFKQETGLTPKLWLRQARLMAAIAALSVGSSVTKVAYDLGYSTSSSFAYMFRRALGVPPTEFRKKR